MIFERPMTVRIVKTGFRSCLGEGPIWIPRLNSVLWVDILGPSIHRLEIVCREVSSFALPEPIGWIVERAGREDFLVGLKSGVAEFDLQTGSANLLFELEPDRPQNRLNDAKVDPLGTLWTGSKDDTDRSATGALYRIASDHSVIRVDDNYGVTNGPTFSLDGRMMYHSDSAARTVYAFDLDDDGMAANRRTWLTFEDDWGFPDGMTTDAEGCIWIAHWQGARVSRFSPDAQLISSVALPATNITSCAFAGPNLDRMYITSSTLGRESEPNAGMLFELDPGVSGLGATAFAG
jgi:sugar lactone lactonase YvrE